MKADLAPIINDSERLLREVVISAVKMPKDYKWMLGAKLRDAGYPKDKYRLLCHNCNCALGWYGYCPHTKDSSCG